MESILKKEKGQALVEYLMLIAMASITAYLVMTKGPLPDFTVRMITNLNTYLKNIVQTGERDPGSKTISSPERFKAVHQ